MDFATIIVSIGIMFLLILPGYFLRKFKMIYKVSVSGFVTVLLYVCQPFLTFKSFVLSGITNPTDPVLLANMGWSLLFGFAGILLATLVAKLVFLRNKDIDRAGIYTVTSAFSNCGFLGLPFLQLLTDGDPYVLIYGNAFIVAFNMLIWTLGVYILTGDIKAMRPQKAILNPAVITLFIALPLFFIPSINIFNMPNTPLAPLQKFITFFADMSAPLSMLIAGVRLADIPFKQLFTDKSSYLAAAIKLLIAPLLMLLICLPFRGIAAADDISRYLLFVPVVMMALPPAATTIALCERFDRDAYTAVKSFLSLTLLSMLTLPLILLIISIVF